MSLLDRFRREPAPPTKARGSSGRRHHHGFLQLEELNRDLQGRMGLEVFDKMWRTDPEVRRNVSMVANPIIAATWEVEPYGGDDAKPRDEEAAEFGHWLFFEHLVPDLVGHLAEAIPLVVRSGFAPFEHVWGRAEWNGRDVLVPKRLSVRLPRSIFRWPQTAEEELEAILQIVPTGDLAGERTIPRSALTYYRVGAEGDNWEGQSLLRPVYKPWFYKDKMERLDALGHEREAIGYPFVYPPAGTATDAEVLDTIDKDIAALRAGEDARVIMPGPHAQDVDEGGWRVDIMGLSGGEGSRDPHPSLQYHKDSIAAAFLAEFMRLGQGQGAVGARATAEEQSNPFEALIEAFVSIFETELNESLLARAVALNFSDVEGAPKLKMSLADGTSLSELASTVGQLVTAGLLTPDHDLEDYLRERGDLPPADPEERAKRDAEKEMMREATAKGIKEGTVGSDGKPVPGQSGLKPPSGGGSSGRKPLDKPGEKPKERRTEKEKTVERFEEEAGFYQHVINDEGELLPATFARQDRPLRTFEEHMDLDRIEAAIDGARERFEQAAGEKVREIAQEVARGELTAKAQKAAEGEVADLLATELSSLYATGRQTVLAELERQQGSPVSSTLATEDAPETLTRRARLAARAIVARIVQIVERLALREPSEAALQVAAEREGAGALRAEAQVHAMPALNQGRDDEAEAHADEIAGSRYTSILDGARCSARSSGIVPPPGARCAEADDDALRPLDDPVRRYRKPPNPDCAGGDRCRCLEFFELKDEGERFEGGDSPLGHSAFDGHWRRQPRDPGGEGGGRWIDGPGGGAPSFTPKVGARTSFAKGEQVVKTRADGTITQTKPVDKELTGKIVRLKGEQAMVQARDKYYVVPSADLGPPKKRPEKQRHDLREDLAQSRSNLSPEQREALVGYTRHGFRMNRNLRRSKGGSVGPEAKLIDSAFDQAKPTEQENVVYRAVQYKRTRTKVAEGEQITDHAFVSTTPGKASAEKFGEQIIATRKYQEVDLVELTIPPGAKVLDVNRLADSPYGWEREMLLPRGTTFRVDSIEPRPKKAGRLIKATVVV